MKEALKSWLAVTCLPNTVYESNGAQRCVVTV